MKSVRQHPRRQHVSANIHRQIPLRHAVLSDAELLTNSRSCPVSRSDASRPLSPFQSQALPPDSFLRHDLLHPFTFPHRPRLLQNVSDDLRGGIHICTCHAKGSSSFRTKYAVTRDSLSFPRSFQIASVSPADAFQQGEQWRCFKSTRVYALIKTQQNTLRTHFFCRPQSPPVARPRTSLEPRSSLNPMVSPDTKPRDTCERSPLSFIP